MSVVEYYRGILREAFDGRPVVLLSGAMQPDLVQSARELGCSGVCALGNRPDPGADAYVRFDSPDWRQALDRFDPDRNALTMGDGFRTSQRLAGRRFVGARPTAWAAYEDKTKLGPLLEVAGVPTARELVVPAVERTLVEAADELDVGRGTVWAGDHRDGEQNGGRHLRWVRNRQEASAAASHFGPLCDQVRVMPFLTGQPCSIHGLVSPTGVSVLRPVAINMRIDRSNGTFEYVSFDMGWEPPAHDADEIRSIAALVGEALADRVAYRGAFCIDGVLTEEGFRPTEVNTRCGLSLTELARKIPELPLRLVHAFMADGHPAGWRPAALEQYVLSRLHVRNGPGR